MILLLVIQPIEIIRNLDLKPKKKKKEREGEKDLKTVKVFQVITNIKKLPRQPSLETLTPHGQTAIAA